MEIVRCHQAKQFYSLLTNTYCNIILNYVSFLFYDIRVFLLKTKKSWSMPRYLAYSNEKETRAIFLLRHLKANSMLCDDWWPPKPDSKHSPVYQSEYFYYINFFFLSFQIIRFKLISLLWGGKRKDRCTF